MTISIQPLTSLNSSICNLSFFSELQERASQLFFKVKEHLFPLEQQEIPTRAIIPKVFQELALGCVKVPAVEFPQVGLYYEHKTHLRESQPRGFDAPQDQLLKHFRYIDLGAIWRDPGQLVEGGIWGAWWAAGVYFLTTSLKELYNVITIEYPGDIRFEKIVLAAKSVFVDLISLTSSSLYAFRWADAAKIIALGQYLPLVRYLCYGTSLLISATETGFDLHQFRVEMKGLLDEQDAFLSNQHFKRVCHLSMKLISSVNMAAWAILGIASLAGVVVHSALMPLLLTVGCVVGVAAIYYKTKISSND